jgi:DNA repair photolyase
MGINEVRAKSILQKSNIPEAEYVVNPYTGCVHGCVYCYARFMKRFTGHSEPWGTFLDAKVNAPARLREQLERRKKPLQGVVFLSSVTDPYLPAESRYGLTRGVLAVLLEFGAPISILTKSDLVLRDLDLLAQFERCTVGLSLMTVDDEVAGRFEPRAPSPTRRLRALERLRQEGLYTYAFLSPYLPRLSDIDRLMGALDGIICEVGVEALNTSGANWAGVERVLRRSFPHLLNGYKSLVEDEAFWDALGGRARHLADEQGVAFMGLFRHGSTARSSPA